MKILLFRGNLKIKKIYDIVIFFDKKWLSESGCGILNLRYGYMLYEMEFKYFMWDVGCYFKILYVFKVVSWSIFRSFLLKFVF